MSEQKDFDILSCLQCGEYFIDDSFKINYLNKDNVTILWCQPCMDKDWESMRDDGWACDAFQSLEDQQLVIK
jgi:hypothetical protein